MNQARIEACATCSTADSDQSLLLYEKTFNMTDRTNSSTWGIICGRPSCNTPAIGDGIRKKSYIYFNFTKFLNNKTVVESGNKIL